MKDMGLRLVLIKGNHDNFVERYKSALGFEVHRQEVEMDGCLFFHGEELPGDTKARLLVMGHEHPAIGIYSKAGRQEKLKCFLFGRYGRKDLLVLPAMNHFAGGTAINMEPKANLMAPVFKRVNVDGMEAIAIGYGSTMNFGTVRDLRKIAKNY
jgi:hypothetical protein